jgi:predicted ATP-binding protein involved in virulence
MAWVADLVGQVFLEAKSPVPAAEMEGIVLIDEIDLHLHPGWQVELIPTLKRVFPRLQFIVTTHSPMVLPGLEQDEIVLLEEDEQGSVYAAPAPASPALMTGSDIYCTFFGIDRLYPVDLGDDLRRYGFLVGNPLRTDEEDQEMRDIRKRLSDHGLDPGWKPVARQERPRFPGRGGSAA